MGDFILTDGDKAQFESSFGKANVVVKPGTLKGSGSGTIGGKKISVEGDESSVSVPGCMYMAGPYVIPGTGTLKIDSLADDQIAEKTQTGGKAVLLKGGSFNATFEVQNPAKQPPKGPSPPEPDSTSSYSGKGSFVNSNEKFSGV